MWQKRSNLRRRNVHRTLVLHSPAELCMYVCSHLTVVWSVWSFCLGDGRDIFCCTAAYYFDSSVLCWVWVGFWVWVFPDQHHQGSWFVKSEFSFDDFLWFCQFFANVGSYFLNHFSLLFVQLRTCWHFRGESVAQSLSTSLLSNAKWARSSVDTKQICDRSVLGYAPVLGVFRSQILRKLYSPLVGTILIN